MHRLNVLILGPQSFISTLNELKPFLKFNSLFDELSSAHEVILFHKSALKDKKQKDLIDSSNSIKIFSSKKNDSLNNYDAYLELPTTLNEINTVVENIVAKIKFTKNSSIRIKKYLLNKNEKKLFKLNDCITLTEKEIQLLELFLDNKKPISKDNILSSVWNYSIEADTHTVETHIYRLRKKISEKFLDEKFILNNKDGYYL
jgi:hypothetical protein